MKKKRLKDITSEEFDRRFDAGEDVSEYFDHKTARVVYPAVQRVNLDIPIPTLARIDQEAARIGITRTSLIKMWLVEHIDKLAS